MATLMFMLSILFMLGALGGLVFNVQYSIALGILSLLFAKYSEQIEKDKKEAK